MSDPAEHITTALLDLGILTEPGTPVSTTALITIERELVLARDKARRLRDEHMRAIRRLDEIAQQAQAEAEIVRQHGRARVWRGPWTLVVIDGAAA